MEDTADHKHPPMSLVTNHKEFAPVRDALAAFGIDSGDVVIQRELSLVPGASEFKIGRHIDIEIRSAAAWAMTEEQRKPIEASLREAVETIAPEADLRIAWCRPVDIEWVMASLNVRDMLSRDWHRRRIDDDAFHTALDRLEELHDRVWNRFEEWRPLMPELDAILEEARRHPAPRTELPPLPKGAVAVEEVVAMLRRILSGDAVPRLVSPKSGWKHLFHSIGEFTADGWTIHAFKRNEGVKYVDKAVAPDGRTGNFDLFASREGGPIDLLEDDEQDRLDEIIEALPPVEASVAGIEAASDCST
jgi:hypothetical protein